MRQQCTRIVAAVAAGIGALAPCSLWGQDRQPISQVLPTLFGSTIVLTPTGSPEFPNHAAHFTPGVDQLQTPEQFNQQIVTLLATFPVGSSSGGFTYTFDPSLGTFSRTSESFGPLFAERALTIGRDRGSLGVGYQRSTYDTFEGKNLRQRDIIFHVEHTDCCGATQAGAAIGDGSRLNPAFEGDIIEAALALRLTTQTIVFYATYGLTDRLDLGVAVPLVSIDADASIRARIERLATAANPSVHYFDGDNPDERIFAASGSATGIGDIVVRAKYNVLRARGGGLAAAVDVRTPTGDESNLLGTGGVQTKVYAVASSSFGKLSPHLNLGYTASTKGALPGAALNDEWNYAAGIDLAVSPQLTLIADVLGRSIRDAGRLREADKVFEFVQTGAAGAAGGGGGG
ncbi:MAG: transporter, partial [Vicinamibacterales bacterium]